MSLHDHSPRLADRFFTRRDFLHRCGMGFGAMALGSVLGEALTAGAADLSDLNPLAPKAPHFPAKAKRVIHLFMNGETPKHPP